AVSVARTCDCCPTRRSSNVTYQSTPLIYTLSLHDALPICERVAEILPGHAGRANRLGDGAVDIEDPRLGIVEQRLRAVAHHRHRSEEHTSELQSRENLVCRLLLEKKKIN